MSRCEKHDLEIISCADCRPRPGQVQATAGQDEIRDHLMSCPCGRGDYGLCRQCPYSWCSVHGRAARQEGPGPWFVAAYNGTCSGCGGDIEPDDEIRADGHGGWERRECCGESGTPPRVIRGPVRLVSWGLDPAHPGYANLDRPATRRSP